MPDDTQTDEAKTSSAKNEPQKDQSQNDGGKGANVETIQRTANAEAAEAESTEGTNNGATAEGQGRGIRIVPLEGGRKKAIVPRNAVFFLNTTTGAGPLAADKIAELEITPKVSADRIFAVGPEIPDKAFPGMKSAKTLAQSTKANLEEKGVIFIHRTGNPAQPAIFEMLVDEYEQKPGMQGVGGSTAARKSGAKKRTQRGGRKKQTPATGAAKKSTTGRRGRKASAPAAQPQTQAAPAARGKGGLTLEAYIDALPVKNIGEAREISAGIEALKRDHPKAYSVLMGVKIAA